MKCEITCEIIAWQRHQPHTRACAGECASAAAYEPTPPNGPENRPSAPRVPAENTAGVPGEPGALALRASVSPGRGAFQRSVVDDAARFAVRSGRPGETDRDRSAPLGPGEDGDCAREREREPTRGEYPCEPAPGEPIPTAFRAS